VELDVGSVCYGGSQLNICKRRPTWRELSRL